MCYVSICNCSFVIEAPHSKLFPVITTPEKLIQKDSGTSESVREYAFLELLTLFKLVEGRMEA